MHKLATRYLFYGSKVNLGSFGVIGVKFWFSLKMHYLFYITKYIHVIHTLASHLRNKQGNWGQSGVDVLKPAGYAVCDGNMSSFLSFFLFKYGKFRKSNLMWNSTKSLLLGAFYWIKLKLVRGYFWNLCSCMCTPEEVARFNMATLTYATVTCTRHVQHTFYSIIYKQNPFNIISRGVQR